MRIRMNENFVWVHRLRRTQFLTDTPPPRDLIGGTTENFTNNLLVIILHDYTSNVHKRVLSRH